MKLIGLMLTSWASHDDYVQMYVIRNLIDMRVKMSVCVCVYIYQTSCRFEKQGFLSSELILVSIWSDCYVFRRFSCICSHNLLINLSLLNELECISVYHEQKTPNKNGQNHVRNWRNTHANRKVIVSKEILLLLDIRNCIIFLWLLNI